MFVTSFGLVLLIVFATDCVCHKNVLAVETNDSRYFNALAADTHAGLGNAYVHHQMAKHATWYHRKQHDRTKMFQSSKLQTVVDDKPIKVFKLHDIADDYRDQMAGIAIGINMLENAENYNDPQQTKSADAILYLNMKLRPFKSEIIRSTMIIKTEVENKLMANGTTRFLNSVRRINPENFKNLTSNQIADVQSIRNGSMLSQNVTRLSANLTKPVLYDGRELREFNPVPLLIKSKNIGPTMHQTSVVLVVLLLFAKGIV